MAVYPGTYKCDRVPVKTLEFGALSEQELSVFTTLIDRRRPLPIYLGDSWRCDACGVQCSDITEMADHILSAHEAEPFNDADLLELLEREMAADETC